MHIVFSLFEMHVNQSTLVETIREFCKSGLDGTCSDGISPSKTFLEIFDEGDCSGGLIGDVADLKFLAAW